MSKYTNFFAMILTSTALMLLLMYFNTYAWDHVFFSETRLYMAIYMGAIMAIVMLLFMLNMYKDKSKNWMILVGAALVFVASLYLVRSQDTINDSAWMSAMIPHHSIAILTSGRANIEDKRVKDLANAIIKAQEREIKEMKWLLDDIEANGIADTEQKANMRPMPNFSKNK